MHRGQWATVSERPWPQFGEKAVIQGPTNTDKPCQVAACHGKQQLIWRPHSTREPPKRPSEDEVWNFPTALGSGHLLDESWTLFVKTHGRPLQTRWKVEKKTPLGSGYSGSVRLIIRKSEIIFNTYHFKHKLTPSPAFTVCCYCGFGCCSLIDCRLLLPICLQYYHVIRPDQIISLC